MKHLSNYHIHSKFCDGEGELEEYVKTAIEKNLKFLGFSSHASLPFPCDWTMKKENLIAYKNEVRRLKEKYKDKIEIFVGLEIDYIPEIISPNSFTGLDYTIGSVHFLGKLKNGERWTVDLSVSLLETGIRGNFDGDIKLAVGTYFKFLNDMVQNSPPNIIGHFDLLKKFNKNNRFFSEDDKWYKELVINSLNIIAKSKCILEVNTGGITRDIIKSVYPSEWILKECLKLNIPITISSDAHKPKHIDGYFEETFEILKKIGYKKYMRLTNAGWEETDL